MLGKRGKLVRDMCEQLGSRAAHAAQQHDEWNVLRHHRGADDPGTGAGAGASTSVRQPQHEAATA